MRTLERYDIFFLRYARVLCHATRFLLVLLRQRRALCYAER